MWVGDEPAPRGTTPLTIELAPGAPAIRVVVRAEGREPASLTVDGSDTSSRHLVLAPAPAAPAPAASAPAHHHHHPKVEESQFKALDDM